MRRERILPVAAALLPAAASAAESAPLPYAGSAQVLLGLAVVVGMIIGAMWLLRRFTPGIGRPGPINVLAAAPVGQRERVVLIAVSDTCLVLGVAPGRVSLLHSLPRSVLPATHEQGAASPFLDRLM